MELLSAIGSVLWRLSLKYRNVQPGKVLLAVKKQHLLMRLFGSTPKTGASHFIGQFFRQVSDQFTSHFSSTKRAHAGGSFRSYGSHTHAAESTSFCGENLL